MLIASFDHRTKKISYFNQPNSKKVVIKPVKGMRGAGVKIVPVEALEQTVYCYPKNCIVEEYVEQHEFLNTIFHESVNTLRILTLKEDETISVVGVILRVGRTSTHQVDNIAQGGICVDVDRSSGALGKGETFYDYGHEEFTTHPDTQVTFYGKKIPYFQEVNDLAVAAHKCFPMFMLIGWDVALTKTGPLIIEGNRVPDLSLHEIYTPLRKRLYPVLSTR